MTRRLIGLRSEIDAVDQQLLGLLAKRFHIVARVTVLKGAEGLPARIEDRIVEVIGSREVAGSALGIPDGAAAVIWEAIVEQSCLFEESLLSRNHAAPSLKDIPIASRSKP